MYTQRDPLHASEYISDNAIYGYEYLCTYISTLRNAYLYICVYSS